MTWYIKWRASAAMVGTVTRYLALAMLLPLVVGLLYGEHWWVFGASFIFAIGLGMALERLDESPDLGPQEGLLFVSLAWLAAALIGALPYILAGLQNGSALAHPVNALFESMSGFTTTGATVMEEISFDRHSHAILMWRQLTQWLGGMGIIVLMIAILPELAVNGAQLMRSEAPGPNLQKLTPKIAETARTLWLIYIVFTGLLIVVLYALHLLGFAPGMDLYNAIAHAFSTLPTGGFSPHAGSIGAFSAIVQWVVIPFMVVAGVNFALFWKVFQGQANRLFQNTEFRAYTGMIAGLTGALFLVLSLPWSADGFPVEETARDALFQVVSLMNSTGFATVDYTLWDGPAQLLLVLAMFIGGSAGSTGGGIKVIRWLVTFKALRRELLSSTSPAVVRPVRLGGKVVPEKAVRGIVMFTLLYMLLFGISAILLGLDAHRAGVPLSVLEAFSASLATIGNIGPGFGALGPFGSYGFFPTTSKLWMVFLMWVGRLEIVPVLGLFVTGWDQTR